MKIKQICDDALAKNGWKSYGEWARYWVDVLAICALMYQVAKLVEVIV